MVSDNAKLVMIVAVNEAVKFKRKYPLADAEDIMPKIMPVIANLSDKEDAKLGAIAGVNSAIRYMDKNPKAKEKEIFQFIMDNSSQITEILEQNQQK